MTWVPGEALLKRVWESVEKFGTGRLSPAQIRREGLARADVRRIELLNEATAQQDVAEVLAGRARLGRAGELIRLQVAPKESPLLLEDMSDQADSSMLLYNENGNDGELKHSISSAREIVEQACISRDLHAFKRLVNLRETVRMAESEVDSEPESPLGVEPPPISPDWLNDWREGAERTSEAEIQRLWAKVLVGEAKVAGSFSLRTLNFLRTLDQQDAKLIEQIAPFVFNGSNIFKPRDEKSVGNLGFQSLLALEEMGVMTGAIGLGLTFTVTVKAGQRALVKMHKNVGIVLSSDEEKSATLGVLVLSRIGVELVKLGDFTTPSAYLEVLAKQYEIQGFTVSRVEYATGWDGHSFIVSAAPIVSPE
ncbi:DUF2806 domain-containing protein [Methylobacterium sp. CM6241]